MPKSAKRECQALIYDGTTGDDYYECKRPAKAWIKDDLKRSGWGGRQYLCGIHARAHDRIASRVKRPLATRI
jgi:hypothetical protein